MVFHRFHPPPRFRLAGDEPNLSSLLREAAVDGLPPRTAHDDHRDPWAQLLQPNPRLGVADPISDAQWISMGKNAKRASVFIFVD